MTDETMNDVVVLIDEDDREHQFEIEAILELDEGKYAILIPLDEAYTNTNEAIIMKFGLDENGEEVLFDIESDEEWDAVADAYDQILESEEGFDFDEEEEN